MMRTWRTTELTRGSRVSAWRPAATKSPTHSPRTAACSHGCRLVRYAPSSAQIIWSPHRSSAAGPCEPAGDDPGGEGVQRHPARAVGRLPRTGLGSVRIPVLVCRHELRGRTDVGERLAGGSSEAGSNADGALAPEPGARVHGRLQEGSPDRHVTVVGHPG